MAFNPFHGFRKHQKTFFAVMVIVCMFVFILQFGAGDVVTRLLNWFGGGRGKGPVVATLNGTKVYESDLGKLARDRQMATALVLYASQEMGQAPFNGRNLSLAQRMTMLREPPFGGFSSNESLLDFLVWRQVADRLGISLTEADVIKAIERVAGKPQFGGKPFAESLLVHGLLDPKNNIKVARGMTAADLLKAVTDEFRVVLAQQSILGQGPGIFGGAGVFGKLSEWSQPAVTPGEFLVFAKEQLATQNDWLLPVPVKDYIDKARELKSSPSDAVLKQLYDDYKGVVPSPERDRPAFKEPERVKVQWVIAGPDAAYFKDEARKRVALPSAYSKLGSRPAVALSIGAQVGLSGGLSAPWPILATGPAAFDRTLAKYVDYTEKQRLPVLMTHDNKLALHDRSLAHPDALHFIANALAVGASPAPGAGAMPRLLTSWAAAAVSTEVHDWQRQLSLQLSTLGYGAPFTLLAHRPNFNDYWEIRDRMQEELEKSEAVIVLNQEMDAFSKELAKLKAKPEEARTFITAAIDKYKFRSGEMNAALDKFDLEKDDKGPKALLDAYKERKFGTNLPSKLVEFLLPEPQQPGQPAPRQEGLTALYEPKGFQVKDDMFLVWRTQYELAREPKFADARTKVLDAWYFEQARNLARQQAEAWSAEAKTLQSKMSAAEVIKQLREKGKDQGFTLYGVAKLTSKTAIEGHGGRTYSPYTVPASTIAYPRPNLVDQLVKRLKEQGDSIVVSDQPERIYYVVVREDQNKPPDLADFEDLLKKTPSDDGLYVNHLLPAKRVEYQKMVLKQLRADAGAPLKEDGEYDLPDGIRPRGGADSNNEGD